MRRVENHGWLVPVEWMKEAHALGREVRRERLSGLREEHVMRNGQSISGEQILSEGLYLDEHEYHPVQRGGQLHESRIYGNESLRGSFAQHAAHFGLDGEALVEEVVEAVAPNRTPSLFAPGQLLEGLDAESLVAEMAAAPVRPRSPRRPISTAQLSEVLGLPILASS